MPLLCILTYLTINYSNIDKDYITSLFIHVQWFIMRRVFFDIIGPILIGLSISYHVSAVWIGNGSLYILSYNPNFLCFLYFKGAATRMR